MSAADRLLQAAMELSPTAREQEAFSAMVNTMRGAGESQRAITVALLQAMLDGVQHGTWLHTHQKVVG